LRTPAVVLLPTQGTLRGLFKFDPAHGESDNRDRIPGTKTLLENGEFTVVIRTGCGQIQVGDQAIAIVRNRILQKRKLWKI
jgi:hypothetical protein